MQQNPILTVILQLGCFLFTVSLSRDIFPGGLNGKASAYNVGDPGSIPGLGRSSEEGNGNPLQYSCLENPMDLRGAWQATVHGVAKSQTQLSDFTSSLHIVKDFGIVNKAEVDVFLGLSCFFDDPADVGNLMSGSSAFSKSSLNIWKFMVHELQKPVLENFEHYFTSV